MISMVFIDSVCGVSLTEVMVLRAVSAPMLKSEPGRLLDTVAGMITMGIHSSSYFPLPWTISNAPENAWKGEF